MEAIATIHITTYDWQNATIVAEEPTEPGSSPWFVINISNEIIDDFYASPNGDTWLECSQIGPKTIKIDKPLSNILIKNLLVDLMTSYFSGVGATYEILPSGKVKPLP